ncbi:MAG: antibiotic biosynthesis monooxygenase [bacterium]|nr:antibiotic biosynthesis monooxygenase [bacterium]
MANQPITIINVIAVDEKDQDRLVTTIADACDTVMRKQPGFLSARAFKSLDGCHIAVQAEWESVEAFQNGSKNPDVLATMRAVAEAGQPEWHLYERVYADSGE